MRSFNGDFPPWRCSGRQRRRGERRRHPLGNKPWKKELHHQDEPWIRSLERMLQWRKRKRWEHGIEGRKKKERKKKKMKKNEKEKENERKKEKKKEKARFLG